jgi:hypothetical protein
VKAPATCPRCGAPTRAPGVWSNSWRCDAHGDVDPVAPPGLPHRERLERVVHGGAVPFWMPWPLPRVWLVTCLTHAGD